MEEASSFIEPDEQIARGALTSPSKQRFWVDWDPLQKYNFVLFVVHLVLTVAIWAYLNTLNGNYKPMSQINLNLYDHIYTFDENQNVFEVISTEAKTLSESALANMIASFFAITAGFHLLYALNPSNIYLNAVKNGNNYLRWLEYSMSATVMIVIIAALSGVKDIKAVFLLATSAVGMIATGQWFETASGNARWIPIIAGFVLLAGIFLVINSAFQDRVRDARAAGFEVPSWIGAIVLVMFMFYASFGFVPIINMFFGGMYRRYEYAYLTLSLASKATLGLLVAFGFGQRREAENPS